MPAVVPQLSSKRVLTTEWMGGLPIDKAASEAIAASLSKPESYVARSCSFDGGGGEGMYRSSRNVGGSVLGRTDEVFHDIRFLICSFLEKVS